MVPWIDEVYSLAGARVLELGCGDGAATFPVASVCGHVDAYDIFPEAVASTRERAAFFGYSNITAVELSPTWALPENVDAFQAGETSKYGAVLLPAVLEHMLIPERLAALRRAWELLRPGGVLVIYDTPNRLYPFDMHSSRLPFADWLPEELLLAYGDRAPRDLFKPHVLDAANPLEALYRFGRGASYHEFDIAIGLSEMRVLADGSSRHIVHRDMNGALGGALHYTMQTYAPHVHAGFARDWLELVLQKKWEKVAVAPAGSVRRELVNGKLEARLMEGGDASLSVDTGVARERLHAEIFSHRWSGVLVARDEAGHEFARAPLFGEVPMLSEISLPLPPGVQSCRLTVEPDARAEGQQAWILGIGAF